MDQRASRVIFTILVIAAGLGFVFLARKTLIAFLFAIFFAYLIEPLVTTASARFRLSRGNAIALVYVGIFAGLAALFISVGPRIVQEAQKLSSTLPVLYQKIASGQIAWQVGMQHGWSRETIQRLQEFLATHKDAMTRIASEFGLRLASIGSNAWWLVLIPILAVFFLKDGSILTSSVIDVFDRRRQRAFAEGFLEDVHVMLAHFIRAQLILAVLTAAAFSLVLTIMRVPYGYVLGVIAGFLEFIPVVGPLLAALLIVGVAIGTGYNHLVILIAFLAVWRGIQDYVTSPRIMGSQVELHPLLALFGILAGAEVGGVIGVYLSIPIMATLRIFWQRWRVYQSSPPLVVAPPELSPAGRREPSA